MELSWPLVGRELELQQIERLLRRRRGAILLAGPAGVGKTRLASEALQLAASLGLFPLKVTATCGAANLPFGAFAHLLPDVALGQDKVTLLRLIADVILKQGNGKTVALLIDDAHLLDGPSAALTHLLAAGGRSVVLATMRTGEPAADPIVALWKDEVAERLDLEPLSLEQVGALLPAVLGGAVDGATAYLFYRYTQGNALFLREAILSALSTDALDQAQGVWRLRGALPASSRLVELIESRLGRLDGVERRTLTVLAVGEPLELQLLTDIVPAGVEALEDRGLVRVERDGRRLTARLPHPLYAEVLRARASALQVRNFAAALGAALHSTGGRRREDPLRLAAWSLDGGRPVPAPVLLRAAATARERYDFDLAGKLARSARESGGGFDAGLLLSQVRWLQGRAEESLELLDGLDDEAASDRQRTAIAMARIGVLDWNLKRPDEALRVAKEAEATISDQGLRDQIRGERARILGRSGRNAEAVALATPLLDRVTGAALVSACFAAGTSMSVTGQASGAISASERGLAAHLELSGSPLPFGPYLHLTIRCKALISAGRLVEARRLGEQEYRKAVRESSVEAQSFLAFELASGALVEGRVATACRLAAESAAAFRELGWLLWIRNASMVRVHGLALLGQVERARSVLEEIDALGVPNSELLGSELLQARAWTSVAEGNVDRALGYLDQAVKMAGDSGAHALESAALHDIARLGHADRAAPRLEELTGVVEGVLATARAAHAAALADQDVPALEQASREFEEMGAQLYSAEASADAAVLWGRLGQQRNAIRFHRRAAVLAARCEGARTPSLSVNVFTRASLTARELEIARLAAEGLTDKQIAGRLVLSHRTVENRLHTVYEKLGLKGRAGLRESLEDPELKAKR